MKTIRITAFPIILLLMSYSSLLNGKTDAHHSRNFSGDYQYRTYATANNQHGVMFKLEYGITQPYDGRVKWRITNESDRAVYDVSINGKEYTLSDGRKIRRSGETITSILESGASKTTMSDAVNTSENKGNWSDRNDTPVVSVKLDAPEIKFAAEKNGKSYGWEAVGQIKH